MVAELIKNVMNNRQIITAIQSCIKNDKRLGTTHISVYMALFLRWNLANFTSPISITRREIMLEAKIRSIATYHKCIKDLHNYGYIKYQPSFHPAVGSGVHLSNFHGSQFRIYKGCFLD